MDHKADSKSQSDRVLDAAEAVVVKQGIGNLTLDAVAGAAGMSKGGLLHHFASKDKLVEAMVHRCADQWRAHVLKLYEREPAGPGRMARVLLAHIADAKAWTAQCQQSSSAVFAALVQDQRLIEPMRAVYGELRLRLAQDKLPPGVGETVLAAMDGLWLYRVLGLATVDQELMDRVRRVLEPLLGGPGKRKPRSRRPVSIAAPARRSAQRPLKKRGVSR